MCSAFGAVCRSHSASGTKYKELLNLSYGIERSPDGDLLVVCPNHTDQPVPAADLAPDVILAGKVCSSYGVVSRILFPCKILFAHCSGPETSRPFQPVENSPSLFFVSHDFCPNWCFNAYVATCDRAKVFLLQHRFKRGDEIVCKVLYSFPVWHRFPHIGASWWKTKTCNS